jgi:hypothetical protein
MSKIATPHGGKNRRSLRAFFTLTEMFVSFAIVMVMLTAVLVIFDRSARIGRDQVEVAAIQQNSRIAHAELLRHVRMAGAGGLPISWKYLPKPASPAGATLVTVNSPGAFPSGFAVSIRNNSPAGLKLPSDNAGGTHWVIPGSDVLTVRGAFTQPVYFYHPAVQTKDWFTAGDVRLAPRKIEIPNRIGSDFRTSLKPLIDYLEAARTTGTARPVLFLVRDLMNPDAYGVLKWINGSADNRLTVEDCTSNTQIAGTQDGFKVGCIVVAVEFDPTQSYAKLGLGSSLAPNAGSPTYPMATSPHGTVVFPHQFGSIAVLQEYRYYVRAEFEVPGDKTSRLAPVLSRTEYFPTAEITPAGTDFIETVDVVDNVIDMQIVAGIDKDWSITAPGHGMVTENFQEGATDTRDKDEILFNHPNDMAEPPGGLIPDGNPPSPTAFTGLGYTNYIRWFHPKLDVYFLRISTVTQSARPDLDYAGSEIGQIEDCDRSVSFDVDGQTINYNDDKKYRRRLLQSIAELRNLK